MSFLKIENLSKRCGDVWALRYVSLEIERGETFGILGASGAGKTILLRLIAGFDSPDSGTISFDGKDYTRLSSQKRGFGSNFSDASFSSRAVVGEIVAANIKTGKATGGEPARRVAEILSLLEISNLESRSFGELSSGQKQLVSLASQIAGEQRLLLLDSPLTNLDSPRLEKTLSALKEWIKNSQTTVIYSTQNQEEAFAFCDRAALLRNGEIIQTGTPFDIYTQPENAAAAAFFGRNNLIRAARLTSNKAALSEFQTLEGNHRLFVDNVEKKKLGAINQIVTLMIRPENLILTFGAAFPEDNLLKAEITEIKRFGAATRIKLDADNLKLEATVIRLIGLKVGDVCLVGLPPNRINVLKD